jgi:NTP pyrophosphatase (non-canonical NTP hydrolase)
MDFNETYADIVRINKKDPATAAERLGKLFEEAGELAKAINKTNGRKILKNGETPEIIRAEIIDEAADTIQNVISVIAGFDITAEEVLQAIANKNIKWEKKVDKTLIL